MPGLPAVRNVSAMYGIYWLCLNSDSPLWDSTVSGISKISTGFFSCIINIIRRTDMSSLQPDRPAFRRQLDRRVCFKAVENECR